MDKEQIQQIKQELIEKAERLRKGVGAFSCKVEIETDCDHENHCYITLNIA